MKTANFKRHFFLLALYMLTCLTTFAQDWGQYFKNRLGSLDPIEGIYSLESVQVPYNLVKIFREDVSTNFFEIVIYKENNNFIMCFSEGGKFGNLVKVGETNIYNYTRYYPNGYEVIGRTRIQLLEGSYFEAKYECILNNEMRRAFSDITGFGITRDDKFIKTYPTSSMIAEAQQQEETPKTWTGSGFALKNGYVVTNYHVVENATTIVVNAKSKQNGIVSNYNASVVGTDKVNDLALLLVDNKDFIGYNVTPYKVATTGTADVGRDVFVLGYPLTSTMGNDIKLTTGIISSKSGYQGDVALYQISAPIQPGNSGGPLFDNNGNIIGVVCAKHIGAENVGYAIKTSYLVNLIESKIDTPILPTNNIISSMALPEKVKKVENFIFMINCSK